MTWLGHKDRGVLRTEHGFGLVEVMVTAVIVVLVATATVTSIGFAQKQTGRSLARNVSANLAEKDQERMRAMRASDLTGYSATTPIQQENGSYTVNSKAAFVQDADSDEVSCTTTGDQAKYLKLTSTVTPPAATDGDPVTISSLYALPIAQYSATSGTLVVKVVRDNGTSPQPSVPVSITLNGVTKSDTTNSLGCAIFQFITPGAWSISLNKPGYVDKFLANPSSGSGTVSPGSITTTTMIYEQAGRIDGTIDPTTASSATIKSFTPAGTTVSNSNILTTAKTRTFTTAPVTSATGLYPFAGSYAMYSGTCAANDPTVYESNFLTAHPGYGQAVVTPGGVSTTMLRQPPLNVTVSGKYYVQSGTKWVATTTVVGGLPVKISQTDTGCTSQIYNTATVADGTLDTEGVPYGKYTVCSSYTGTLPDKNGNNVTGTWSASKSVDNKTFAGSATTPVLIDATNSPNGGC